MPPASTIDPATSLASLATTHAGASLVFRQYGLDFCCHGQESLASACSRKGLDPADVAAWIAQEPRPEPTRWDERSLDELIGHLLERYHEPHRADLPHLIALAEKVERVHGDKLTCPRGLARHLARMLEELEDHMRKEEQVLFPLILSGRGRMAAMPVQLLETEHRDHAANLARLRELTGDFTAPDEACTTWQALYLGLSTLELDLMRHIHLENNVLFPRALRA